MKIYRIMQGALVAVAAMICLLPAAQATIPDADGVYWGCYTKSGTIRVIDNEVTKCKREETLIYWNRVGPQGLKGDKGDTGSQGPAGPAASKADGPCYNDNNNRYQDCGHGTVTDTVTGLIWLKDANCFGSLDWAAANQAAATLADGQCDLSDKSSAGDWRLPTKEEWEATVARARAIPCTFPALTDTAGSGCYSSGSQPFKNVQEANDVQGGNYWLSTTDSNLPSFAWFVLVGSNGSMSGGPKDGSGGLLYVWPVRGGR